MHELPKLCLYVAKQKTMPCAAATEKPHASCTKRAINT